MALAATSEQKELLNERGFFVIEEYLVADEVAVLNDAFDEVGARLRGERGMTPDQPLSIRNGLVKHEAFLNLMDRPDILRYVVDIVGWNVQNRDSVILWTPPQPGRHPSALSLGWHFDYEEEFTGIGIDGPMPWLDFKIGWYVSDATEADHATILFVPGSHRWDAAKRARWREDLPTEEIHELKVPPGSLMMWRPTLLHAASPNLSTHERRALYISYAPRWIRPSGHVNQDPDLVARSNPVRRQLLGAMGNLSHPLGSDPENHPDSQYWFAWDWDVVPLKAWAEAEAGDRPHDWGTGYGVGMPKGPGFQFTDNTDPRRVSVTT